MYIWTFQPFHVLIYGRIKDREYRTYDGLYHREWRRTAKFHIDQHDWQWTKTLVEHHFERTQRRQTFQLCSNCKCFSRQSNCRFCPKTCGTHLWLKRWSTCITRTQCVQSRQNHFLPHCRKKCAEAAHGHSCTEPGLYNFTYRIFRRKNYNIRNKHKWDAQIVAATLQTESEVYVSYRTLDGDGPPEDDITAIVPTTSSLTKSIDRHYTAKHMHDCAVNNFSRVSYENQLEQHFQWSVKGRPMCNAAQAVVMIAHHLGVFTPQNYKK